MGQVMVMLLDEKLALTETQRQKLEPIADQLVKGIPQLYPEGANSGYSFISPDVFYTTTGTVSPAALKPILDPSQLKRWQDLGKSETPQMNVADADSTPVTVVPSQDVERTISTFFYEKSESERKRELAVNTLKAEDISRVVGLKADAAERLQAAAYGATEQSLMNWKWFTEQQIRSQLQNPTPQDIKQRLEGLQDYFFQRNFGNSNQQNVWDQIVQTELTAQQLDVWKKETDARENYRDNAISALALSELDRKAHLTDAQWSKLLQLVSGVLNDHKAGITQFFSGMNGTPWYLGGPYVMIPLAGVEDQDMKSILTKDQMNIWTGSQEYANANNLWNVVKQMQGFQIQRQQQVQQHPRRAASTVIKQ
jgi:hypothetical protein